MFPGGKQPLSLTPPPAQPPSAMENMLTGIKNALGLNPVAPVAQSRFTRTPIYPPDSGYWGPATKGGEYNPETGVIKVPPQLLQEQAGHLIPHESAHDIYHRAGLTPESIGDVPSSALAVIAYNPQLYPPLQKGASPEEIQANKERTANEGLAYSVGRREATPFIEDVASQIKDPKIAQQLLRLHENAVATRRNPPL